MAPLPVAPDTLLLAEGDTSAERDGVLDGGEPGKPVDEGVSDIEALSERDADMEGSLDRDAPSDRDAGGVSDADGLIVTVTLPVTEFETLPVALTLDVADATADGIGEVDGVGVGV